MSADSRPSSDRHMFPERIETERLVLSALSPNTVDPFEFYEYCRAGGEADEFTRYLSWEPHRTVKKSFDFVREAEERRENHEAVEYVVRPAEGEENAGEFAGITGMRCDWDRRTAEFGMWLRPPFWGRGYSGERAAALIELAFDRLGLELVTAGYLTGNEQSKRAIEKYTAAHGGGYDGVLRNWVPKGGDVYDLHRYTVTREQYREAVKK